MIGAEISGTLKETKKLTSLVLCKENHRFISVEKYSLPFSKTPHATVHPLDPKWVPS